MSKNSYYVTKTKGKKEIISFELEKLDGYKVNPKIKEKDMIGVSKIVFVNDDMAEKVIRKKVDKKIEYLLKQLKNLGTDDDGEDGIRKSLMDAEKLRLQMIQKYVKYLGNTYHSLTLKKLDVIIEELRYKLYLIEYNKQNSYDEVKEGRRGR